MKFLYIVVAISLIYLFLGSNTKDTIVIPDESIRLRVIANSNSEADQNIKFKVKNNLEKLIANILKDTDTLEQATEKVNNNMFQIRQNIKSTLQKENKVINFNVNFGKNYFPEKELYGVKYMAGNYDSLVVTLGEGLGDNWWCVLFPPLCLIEAEEHTETEYRIYVKDVLNKYL